MIFPFPLFFKKKIEVQSMYNVVLILDVQQSDSVIHIYVYPQFSTFFPITGYYRISNVAPSAIQQFFIVYFLYSMYLLTPNSQSIPFPPSLCLWGYFFFINKFLCIIFIPLFLMVFSICVFHFPSQQRPMLSHLIQPNHICVTTVGGSQKLK